MYRNTFLLKIYLINYRNDYFFKNLKVGKNERQIKNGLQSD